MNRSLKECGIWKRIINKVVRVELNEITKIIGKQKIDFNQDLWEELHALNEILLETRCFDESNPFSEAEQVKSLETRNGKVGKRADLRIFSSNHISIEDIQRHAEIIRASIDMESEDLQVDIALLQSTIDMRTDQFLTNQSNPKSPATKEEPNEVDVSLITQNKEESNTNEVYKPSYLQLQTSKSEQKLVIPTTVPKSTTPPMTMSIASMSSKCCSRCANRLDSEALAQISYHIRNRQKGVPLSTVCTTCRQIEKRLKKEETKLGHESLLVRDMRRTETETETDIGRKSGSKLYMSMSELSLEKPVSDTRNQSFLASPIPPISISSNSVARTEGKEMDSPLRPDSSKFRRRLQSVRDEKHFFDDD